MTKFIKFVFIICFLTSGCSEEIPEEKAHDGRWMDRTIYFATTDPEVDRNNTIHKVKVQEALKEIEASTTLGEGYFKFQEIDESELDVTLESGTLESEQKSFILIWPDSVFNQYVTEVVNGSIPDPNAIAVINSANKRKFFIIIRASCLSSSSNPNPQCANIGTTGFKALVARQLGFLVGMPAKNCDVYPNDVMCVEASSQQFTPNSKLSFSSAFNNSLEAILLNPNYYD